MSAMHDEGLRGPTGKPTRPYAEACEPLRVGLRKVRGSSAPRPHGQLPICSAEKEGCWCVPEKEVIFLLVAGSQGQVGDELRFTMYTKIPRGPQQ